VTRIFISNAFHNIARIETAKHSHFSESKNLCGRPLKFEKTRKPTTSPSRAQKS